MGRICMRCEGLKDEVSSRIFTGSLVPYWLRRRVFDARVLGEKDLVHSEGWRTY